jgi:hypothetical protein
MFAAKPYNQTVSQQNHKGDNEMRKLSPIYRLQGYSTEDLVAEWDHTSMDHIYRRKLKGRKLKAVPLLSAIILWWLSLPHEDRDKIVVDGLKLLEQHLDDPEDGEPDRSKGKKPKPVDSVSTPAPAKKASPGRKRRR